MDYECIFENSKCQNLNKFIITGKNGGKPAWRITLYNNIMYSTHVQNQYAHILSIFTEENPHNFGTYISIMIFCRAI